MVGTVWVTVIVDNGVFNCFELGVDIRRTIRVFWVAVASSFKLRLEDSETRYTLYVPWGLIKLCVQKEYPSTTVYPPLAASGSTLVTHSPRLACAGLDGRAP